MQKNNNEIQKLNNIKEILYYNILKEILCTLFLF